MKVSVACVTLPEGVSAHGGGTKEGLPADIHDAQQEFVVQAAGAELVNDLNAESVDGNVHVSLVEVVCVSCVVEAGWLA